MSFLKSLGIYAGVLLISYITRSYFAELYDKYFEVGGSWLDLSQFGGALDGYLLFSPLLFEFFGFKNRYWWLVLLLLPVAFLEFYISLSVIYYPLILIFAGFALGYVLRKLKEFILRKISEKKAA